MWLVNTNVCLPEKLMLLVPIVCTHSLSTFKAEKSFLTCLSCGDGLVTLRIPSSIRFSFSGHFTMMLLKIDPLCLEKLTEIAACCPFLCTMRRPQRVMSRQSPLRTSQEEVRAFTPFQFRPPHFILRKIYLCVSRCVQKILQGLLCFFSLSRKIPPITKDSPKNFFKLL